MKIIGLNCSPRKSWNTAQMVQSALKGASDAGAETKLYDLYSMTYRGCSSCFECLRLGGESFGRCAMRDELKPVLDEVLASDGFIVGSPIYFSDVTACCRAFLERLWFGGLSYGTGGRSLYEKKVPSRIIFTTNAPMFGFHKALNESVTRSMETFVGPTEILEANATLQFDDYSKYDAAMINEADRKARRDEVFPIDLQNAYDTGAALVK